MYLYCYGLTNRPFPPPSMTCNVAVDKDTRLSAFTNYTSDRICSCAYRLLFWEDLPSSILFEGLDDVLHLEQNYDQRPGPAPRQ